VIVYNTRTDDVSTRKDIPQLTNEVILKLLFNVYL